MSQEFLINKLPSPTWRWLKLNGSNVKLEDIDTVGAFTLELPKEVSCQTEKVSPYAEEKTALGEGFDRYIQSSGVEVSVLSVPEGTKTKQPAKFIFSYSGAQAAANQIAITVEKNAELTVIMDFVGGDIDGLGAVSTKYHVAEGGKLTVVQIQNVSKQMEFYNDLGGTCEEKGEFKLVQLVLNAKKSYVGNRTALVGKASDATMHIGYYAENEELIDMNYITYHTGLKTTCDINASGVLQDKAQKNFRGTIDFQRGTIGSVGSENEEVLLMDDGVINKSIPIILCQEEDVEGTHGASIGKLDDATIFYMQSRGLSPETIYEIMAKARIRAIINQITHEETRDRLIKEFVGEEED